LICQVCGQEHKEEQEYCVRCHSKLLVISGPAGPFEEPDSGETVGMDEHLLERVSVLEEIVKRSAETLKTLLEALNRQEKNGFVVQTGVLAVKDLLERKGILAEEELLDLWESRVDVHMAATEKRERFLERRERMVAGFGGERKERFLAFLSEAEFAFYALDPEKALRALEEAWKLDRGNAELAFFLGESAFNEGETARAATMLHHVLARDPHHFEALVYCGVLENEAGRTAKAVELLKQAISIKPDAFLPYFALGALYATSGQLARAEVLLKKALMIEENAQTASLLGTIAYERGRLPEAIEHLQKTVRLDPTDEEALYLLGLSYLDRGWTQKAADQFRAALELNPNRIEYQAASALLAPAGLKGLPKVRGEAAKWARRAEAAASGEPLKALELFRKALATDADNPTLLISYALVCSAAGRTAEAVSATKRVLAKEQGELVATAAYTTLLEALRSEGKFREGDRIATEMLSAVKSNYARSIACFQRATALAEMGEKLDEALSLAEQSLKLSPREMRHFPLAAKGWVHYKRREFDRAVECLRRAAELGETPTGLTHLGLAYLAVGDSRAARAAFSRAKRRGGARSARRGGIETKMLEQIRRNLHLTEKLEKGKRTRAR